MSWLILIAVFFCVSANAADNWPLSWNSDKGPETISISRRAKPLAYYLHNFPDWTGHEFIGLHISIISTETEELGKLDGLRIEKVHLSLKDDYYTDELMILQEVQPKKFLPAYVQLYNQGTRHPTEITFEQQSQKFILRTGVFYEGTGHYRDKYQIIIFPEDSPEVIKIEKP